MSKQSQADSRLERTVVLVLSLVVVLLLLLQAPLKEDDRGVPPNLVQHRFLQSLVLLRGQWLLYNRPEMVDWKAPDGEYYQVRIDPHLGWPNPERDCGLLWQQLMGKAADSLLQWQRFQQDYCRFELLDNTELRYYPQTGSVILEK